MLTIMQILPVTAPSLFPAILLIAKDRISILNVMLFKIN